MADVFERVGTPANLAYLKCRMSRCDSFAEALDMMSGGLYEVSKVSKPHRFTWRYFLSNLAFYFCFSV